MSYTLKLTQIEDSVGIILPQDVLTELNITKEQSLYLIKTEIGFHITTINPGIVAQMKLADEIMHRRNFVLRELSK